MALKDIVQVNITRQTASIVRVGFGVLALVYDTTTAPANRIATFGDADEVNASPDLTPSAKAALSAAFTGDLAPVQVKAIHRLVGQLTPEDNETYTDALDEAQELDEAWYAITIQSREQSDILAVASWTEARTKLFIAASQEPEILDPNNDTDIASLLLANSYSRTALIYSSTAATTYPDTAWAGPILPNDPGSVTWAFKTVRGVAGEAFNGQQIAALEAKRVTRIETIQTLSRTIGGYTSDPGSYVDIIRGVDWLEQTMAEDVFMQLVNSAKIPFTNTGIAIIEGIIRSRLQIAINRNVIDDDENLIVTVPKVEETDSIDRANRFLRDVKFSARLSGAIHKVLVQGTVSI